MSDQQSEIFRALIERQERSINMLVRIAEVGAESCNQFRLSGIQLAQQLDAANAQLGVLQKKLAESEQKALDNEAQAWHYRRRIDELEQQIGFVELELKTSREELDELRGISGVEVEEMH